MGEGTPRSDDSSDVDQFYDRSVSTTKSDSSHDSEPGNTATVSAIDYIEKDKEVVILKEVVKRYRRKNKRLEKELEQQRELVSDAFSNLQETEAEANEEICSVTSKLSDAIQVLVEELKISNTERDAALREIEAMEKNKIESDFKMYVLKNERAKLVKDLEELRKDSHGSRQVLERIRKERDALWKTIRKVSKERDESFRNIEQLENTHNPANDKHDECFA